MSGERTCPTCGALVGSGAPEGLCPACLLGAGLEIEDADDLRDGDPAVEAPSDTVDRFRLIEKIGEGGFGVVFRAEQEEPVRRVVALKVIKPGMDSQEVITRFAAERQALALMDHSSIAKVYDGGTTVEGRPYFVMELVDGQPITSFCEEHNLRMRDRLRLFSTVCQAVQHAHQKGVIHRDLKPSNILVTWDEDGKALPKIIDFGVAKAIGIELTEKTFVSILGRMVGTPKYMSPEQAELNALDVDTRSDIYSLGVILYELVTGRTPLFDEEVSSVSFDELRRRIREEDPPKPSAYIAGLSEEQRDQAARARGLDPARYQRYLQRDLDWVAMKALEKDRNRRYDTPHDLAIDIRRFLINLPVVARPPEASYRVGKFVRRHWRGVAVASLILLAILATTVGVLIGYFGLKERSVAQDEAIKEKIWQGLEDALATAREKVGKKKGDKKGALELLYWDDSTAKESQGDQDKRDELETGFRNQLIACLGWTDLESADLTGPLEDPWARTALDPDRDYCALGFPSGRLEVRDVSGRGEESICLREGREAPVEGPLEFSPDGSCLVAGLGDREAWKVLLVEWKNGTDLVESPVDGVHQAFDFHPKERIFVVGTAGKTLEVRDYAGRIQEEAISLDDVPVAVRFSPDGRFMAVATRLAWEILHFPTGEPARDPWVTGASGAFPTGRAVSLAWAPDSREIAVGMSDGSVVMVGRGASKLTNRPMRTASSNPIDQIAWSSDGEWIACGSREHDRFFLWDARQRKLLCDYDPAYAGAISFSNDNGRIGPFLSGDQCVKELKIDRALYHTAEGHPRLQAKAAIWSHDLIKPWDDTVMGSVLITGAEDGLRIWNEQMVLLHDLSDVRVRSGGLACSTTHLYAAADSGIFRWTISADDDGTFHLGESQKLSGIADSGSIVLGVKGAFLAVARDSEVVLLDPATGAPQGPRLSVSHPVSYLTVSPDGSWLAAGTRIGTRVRLWDLSTKEKKFEDLPVGRPAAVAFYPKSKVEMDDGRTKAVRPMLVTGDEKNYSWWRFDSDSRKWREEEPSDEATGASEMANRRGMMPRVVFSPRGTALAVSFNQRHLRVLDPRGSEIIAQPSFDEQLPLAINMDGRLMTTEDPDGGLFNWNLKELREQLDAHDLDFDLDSFEDEKVVIIRRPDGRP